MELVNPLTSFTWTTPLDIRGVPMQGVPEKLGVSFSRAGYLAAKANPCLDADAVGRTTRQQMRPLSAPTLVYARDLYQRRAVPSLPPYYIIEPTAFCNKACPFCSIHVIERLDEEGNPGSTMSRWDDYVKLMTEVGPSAPYGISIYGIGEPMLWRGKTADGEPRTIADLVKAAKTIGHFTVANVSTNADVANLDLLLDCPVDDVIVSIDGTTEEVYAANRPSTKPNDPGAFERTLSRVHRFLARRAADDRPGPFIRIQCINKADTAPQIVDFIRYWIEVPGVGDVYIKNLEAMTPWLGHAVVSEQESALKMARIATMPCQHLWAIGAMSASGQFLACCHDARSELWGRMEDGRVPNIRTTTFAEWWHGPFMTALRREHTAGVFRQPCATCHERDPWLG